MEHAWENHHPIDWEETTVLDRGRGQELLLKEALHIQMTPSEEQHLCKCSENSLGTVVILPLYTYQILVTNNFK